ncbi:uncharacterized protein LOC103828855 isoform X2 [Brassica rapa]|uniref:uncharacterized protein LOC103828855 isoform X2 n=1 Tax=Brassica campestris TaxID=3711 RepID=UPI00142E89A3|nr:uncharacterized protein LOC103828855 isoform X2 [Brassica rapa]
MHLKKNGKSECWSHGYGTTTPKINLKLFSGWKLSLWMKRMVNTDNLAPCTVTQMVKPTSNKVVTVDDFPLSCFKTIDQLMCIEESTCVMLASILAIQKAIPWFYVGCKGCCGKATPYFNPVTEEIEANKYACDSCEKEETITSIRYKLQVKVADHTGSTSFLLFDREVIQLIHKSAYELLEQQVQFNREDEIPQELLGLEGRKIVWVIRVKGTEKNFRQPSFNVVKLSDTPDVIHNFQDNMRMEVEKYIFRSQ